MLGRITGSRTPGGMTPSHDGSMTPRGAWDPTVTNTPARPSEFEYFDEATPSPNYNPTTPGGYAMNNFAPHTPGNFQCNASFSLSISYSDRIHFEFVVIFLRYKQHSVHTSKAQAQAHHRIR